MGMPQLNYLALMHILKVTMYPVVEAKANEIAASVDVGSVTDAKVGVRMVITDRAHANVTIMHPAGIAMEAKHGTLRRAAATAGLEVSAKKIKGRGTAK
jgi:hypothetical protein